MIYLLIFINIYCNYKIKKRFKVYTQGWDYYSCKKNYELKYILTINIYRTGIVIYGIHIYNHYIYKLSISHFLQQFQFYHNHRLENHHVPICHKLSCQYLKYFELVSILDL